MITIKDKIKKLYLKKNKHNKRITSITAYDYTAARIADESGIDIILVGDSLGMMIMGFEDTTSVKMKHILHHIEACKKGINNSILVADLPYNSYKNSDLAVKNAKRLISAGAEAVKLEGGTEIKDQITALIDSGIPLMGHIGMLPQSIKIEGRYRKKGKTENEIIKLVNDGKFLDKIGVFSIVIECVESEITKEINKKIDTITIGIGSGDKTCDGEIAVFHDVIGAYPWFVPPFAKRYSNVAENIKTAIGNYIKDING